MSYVALYRQWRPQDFDNLVGQDHISTTLKNAITAGKIAHAFLFAGPRGTGKTSTAKILAKALNCVNGPTAEPCNVCSNCVRITNGSYMDVFEIDAASNRGIDEIRDLRETVKFAPVDGKYKVYIIDEVHMLTTEAFNALLKTLEEPPAHAVFILATTEPHKIPATIHSRCQRYDFRRIGVREIQARLDEVCQKSGLDIAPEALHLIARQADGGMRDALSILDQCAALGESRVAAEDVRRLLGLIGHEWVWKITDALAGKDPTRMLTALSELINRGKDVRQLLLELILHARSLMVYKAAPGLEDVELYTEDPETLEKECQAFSHEDLVNMINTLHEAVSETRWSPDPRITAEMALLSICNRTDILSLQALNERVAALEARLQEGAPRVRLVEPQHVPAEPLPVKPKAAEPREIPTVAKKADTDEPTPPRVAVSAEIGEVWERVLKELVSSGKRSVQACVSQGQLVALDENEAVIQFAIDFSRERTEKPDYRAILENIFQQVTGNAIHLRCIKASDPAPSHSEPKPSAAHLKKQEEYPDAVRQAQMLFGGKIIKEHNEEV